MKFIIRILLISFLFYQVAPTMMAILDDDISYNITENDDENESLKDCKDLKMTINNVSNIVFNTASFLKKSKIVSNHIMDFDSITTKIFLTPPENA